jgi:hypothetical protein
MNYRTQAHRVDSIRNHASVTLANGSSSLIGLSRAFEALQDDQLLETSSGGISNTDLFHVRDRQNTNASSVSIEHDSS